MASHDFYYLASEGSTLDCFVISHVRHLVFIEVVLVREVPEYMFMRGFNIASEVFGVDQMNFLSMQA